MERDVLYRGKSVNSGEWVYGNLLNVYDGTKDICFWRSELVDPENNYSEMRLIYDTVHAETVGQYIGLQDKNGKDIYEGDKLHDNLDSDDVIDTVYWDEELLGWNAKPNYPESEFMKQMKIIGNIHD